MKRVRARWTMKFLPGTKVVSKVGDKVEEEEVLGEEKNEISQSLDMSAVLSKLSPTKLAELNSKNGQYFNEGDLLITESGWFGKKILAPISGKMGGVDEFYNIKFFQGENKIRKIISPVEGKVVKKDNDSLTIEFGAVEINGEGLIAGKTWADGLIRVEKISDIGTNCVDKVVILENIVPALVVKIEAIGGVGIVVKDAKISSRLPVLVLEETEFEKIKNIKNGENKRILLNTAGGRLLLVE